MRLCSRGIASVYTQMNAISKGVAKGVFEKGEEKGIHATSAQPHVDLMGRRYAGGSLSLCSVANVLVECKPFVRYKPSLHKLMIPHSALKTSDAKRR